MTQQSSPSTHPGFFGWNGNEAFVLGSDGNLWFESAPWGHPPPSRQEVGGHGVLAFAPINENPPSQVLVLGTNHTLWLNTLGQGTSAPQIDGNVAAFDGNVTSGVQLAYVLGTDGNLWLEHGPWGTVPPPRQHVDGNVRSFQTIDANKVFVLGNDGNLWLETGPWGTVPPSRIEIGGGNIAAFQALGSAPGLQVFVLAHDGTLWLNTVGGGSSGQQVGGGNIAAFQVAPGTNNQVYVLAKNRTFWLNTVGEGATAPQIDANAVAFHAIDNDHVYVLGSDGKLWLEQGPWGHVPPTRQLVDQNVSQQGDVSTSPPPPPPSDVTVTSSEIVFNHHMNLTPPDGVIEGPVNVTITSNGAFNYSGQLNSSCWSSDNVSVLVVLKSKSGTAFVFGENGSIGAGSGPESLGSNNNLNWGNNGTNPTIHSVWGDLQAGCSSYYDAQGNTDLAALWNQLQAAVGDVEKVVAVVGAV